MTRGGYFGSRSAPRQTNKYIATHRRRGRRINTLRSLPRDEHGGKMQKPGERNAVAAKIRRPGRVLQTGNSGDVREKDTADELSVQEACEALFESNLDFFAPVLWRTANGSVADSRQEDQPGSYFKVLFRGKSRADSSSCSELHHLVSFTTITGCPVKHR